MGRTLALVVGASILLALPAGASAQTRYELAGGCFNLRAQPTSDLVGKSADGYVAGAGEPEPFRMQATTLGEYLLYGSARDFLAVDGDAVAGDAEPSGAAEWRVEEAGAGAFRLVSPATDRQLGVEGGGRLVAVAGGGTPFEFVSAQGCPAYPEVEVSATGSPLTGSPLFGETRGLIDAHMHMMAFEFLGGRAHCGRPWHPYGAPYALVDCPDHTAGNGCAAVLENLLFGDPARCHDPVGWPTFKDWPHHKSLTHEQSYYKWLERAWMGGLRVFVNLLVENRVLCEIYPLKQNDCNEMQSVRLQARDIRELEAYIDAQNGGPGKGWFRIVTDPFEARRVINQGKLAVVLGIEVSELFDCGVNNDVPKCDRAQIDRFLDEVYDLGVRDMELINKFDNALGGVAGDSGTIGPVVNVGNLYSTGKFWQLQTCTGEAHDHEQPGVHNADSLVANGVAAFLPAGVLPVYPDAPHCNTRGLSELGEHLIRRMIEKRMIIDPDHLSVLARNQALALVEAERYSGIVSSHSWSTPDAFPRIYKLGGVVTPYAGDSSGFAKEWEQVREMRDERFYFGFGYGADMNGFGSQGGPRGEPSNPVRYPFKSFDGGVTLERQRSGERVFDINTDGVAHYGLYPDWIEDLRMISGEEIVEDMSRGAEAYLQMWERAVGVPATRCQAGKGFFRRRGLGRLRLGMKPEQLLVRAGQPSRRRRAWRWCARGKRNGKAKVVTVFTPRGKVGLVFSTARRHKAKGVGPGARASRLRVSTTRLGRGLRTRRLGRRGPTVLYGVRGGRVRFVALASRSVARKPARLRAHLKLARRG